MMFLPQPHRLPRAVRLVIKVHRAPLAVTEERRSVTGELVLPPPVEDRVAAHEAALLKLAIADQPEADKLRPRGAAEGPTITLAGQPIRAPPFQAAERSSVTRAANRSGRTAGAR